MKTYNKYKEISKNERSKLCAELVVEIIPTKNTLPILPEEIVHKIMLMTYELRPHPVSAIIQYQKDIIRVGAPDWMVVDMKYYQKFLSSIVGDTKKDFMDWWIEKMVYKKNKYRLCAEEMETAWLGMRERM